MTYLFITPIPLQTSSSTNFLRANLFKSKPTIHHRLQPQPTRRVRQPNPSRTIPRSDASEASPGEQLIQAAMMGDLPTVDQLLASGAPPGHTSHQNNSGMTALMWASAEGHVQIVKALLAAGASPNTQTPDGQTAILYAFENLPNINPRAPPPPGFPGQPNRSTPPQVSNALYPRVTGHSDVIKMLIAAGANLRVNNTFGESFVHMAARRAHHQWIDVCLAAGIDVEQRSRGFQETALHIAAKEGHLKVVQMLCEKGARVDVRSRYGWTPLIWAAACANYQVVEFLVAFGADVNAVAEGYQGVRTTALKEARKSSRPTAIAKLLVDAGAKE